MQITKIYKYMEHAQLSYDVTCILLDFSLTVKAAPHECVIKTGQS